MRKNENTVRCGWCGDDPDYMRYHDLEWGREVKDENVLFEFLVLETAQAGLSWLTILRKREGYRRAFAGFDPEKVAAFPPGKIEELMQDSSIVRNRKKIESTITNARIFLEIQKEFGAFAEYIRSFLPEGKPVVNAPADLSEIPASTPVSEAISKELKKRGFRFFGSTVCYAWLQAVGFVNDHIADCSFR